MIEINPLKVSDLMKKQFPPTESILGSNLIDKQGAILISGPQKIGKSLFGSQMALSIGAGTGFLDFEASGKHRTLILQAEVGERRMKERFDKQAGDYTDTAKDNVLTASTFSSVQLDNAEGVAAVAKAVEEYRPDLVLIDPLACFHGGDENDARDMTAVMNGLNAIRKVGPAIVLVHHHGKSSRRQSNVGHKARGSSVIPGWYDSHFSLEWADSKDRTVRLDFELRNGEAPESKILRLDPTTLQFISVDEETGQIGLVLSAIRQLGPSDAEPVAEHYGKVRQWASTWLNRAVAQGKLLKREGRPAIFYLPEQQVEVECGAEAEIVIGVDHPTGTNSTTTVN